MQDVRELLIDKIQVQSNAVLLELWRYLRILEHQTAEHEGAELLPSREVEQEVLDLLQHTETARSARLGSGEGMSCA